MDNQFIHEKWNNHNNDELASLTKSYHTWYIKREMSWIVTILNETVEKKLEALPVDMRASFIQIVEMIEEFGLQQLGMPHVRHLLDKLCEMRLKG